MLSVLKANTSVGKNSFLRDMIGLKTLMEKRMEQRGLTLYYLSNKKFQSALIYCRQLTFSSMKVYKEYSDEYNDEFEENFFSRTCKAKEHLEYLLDCIIACRVFIEAKKKEDAIDILEKVELNENQKEKQIVVRTEADKVRFNEQHEIMSKMCAALLSFIEIAKSEKLYDYCEKYFKIYVNYVKNNYGIIEYSTALFKYGNYLYETKNYEASEENFKTCVEIRKNNVINSCLVDALLNLSICQRELAHYEEAIKNTKDAIQIYKDIKINDEGIDHYYLFLAKLLLEYAQFEEAYCNYLKCFKYRQQYDNSHPGKIEIEINMMMFYKILKDVTEKHREILNVEDKKVMEERRREATEVYSKMKNTILEREEFSKYRDFKSSRFSHLNLFISKDFFDSLTANHIVELNSLLSKLGDLTFARGMAELQKCSFFEEKKLRDLLMEKNGHLKKGHARKTNS